MMMLGAYLFVGALLAAAPSEPAAPAAGSAGSDLVAVALKYLSAERERQVEGATQGSVETALAFLTDAVVYEHPKAGARIEGKDSLRKGMLGFLGAVRSPRDKVISVIAGPGVVVLDLRQTFEMRRDKSWEPQTRSVVKVLEFEGEKIKRIIDYW